MFAYQIPVEWLENPKDRGLLKSHLLYLNSAEIVAMGAAAQIALPEDKITLFIDWCASVFATH